MLTHGHDLLTVGYAYDRVTAFMASPEEEMVNWIVVQRLMHPTLSRPLRTPTSPHRGEVGRKRGGDVLSG
jgi:hypothetical protein